MALAVEQTFREIAAFDALSEHEQAVADYNRTRLEQMGFKVSQDEIGNVIGYLPGEGEPILLNAHMDGVGPAKGHKPVKENGYLQGDSTTNVRADDIAGNTVILEAVGELVRSGKKHMPIVVAFTVQEEIGLFGAKALDVSKYGVKQGIVYDNGLEAGTMIASAGAYRALNIRIVGKSAHPAKDMNASINPVDVFVEAGVTSAYWDDELTTVNMGMGSWGEARNMVPGEMLIKGELRSYLFPDEITERVERLSSAFEQAAAKYGARVEVEVLPLAEAYVVKPDEPLVKKYREVVENRGGEFRTGETLIASDANAFRQKDLGVFVVSTGVEGEHSLDERIEIQAMEMLARDLIELLATD